jgi:hypothetical protein
MAGVHFKTTLTKRKKPQKRKSIYYESEADDQHRLFF